MASALLSLAGNKQVRSLAMTGELTLTGQIFRVGGIKEKVLAARRAGIHELLLPEDNRGDYEELPEDVTEGMSARFVSHYDDVFPLLFESGRRPALVSN